jgi:fucose permease
MNRKTSGGVILLSFIAFISLGLPDGLLGVAWPSIRHDFAIPLDAIGTLLAASTAGYILSSFFSGVLVKLLGIGRLLSASCAITAAALIGYTVTPVWALIPILGFFAGVGAGAIDAGLNTYVANNFGEGLMQWLHASFGVGITLGPLIMTLGLAVTGAWRTGYLLTGAAQLILAVGFILSRRLWELPEPEPEQLHPPEVSLASAPLRKTLTCSGAWTSIFMFLVYTGIEVSIGLWTYTLLTESRNLEPSIAGLLTGGFWGMFTIGRIAAGLYTRKVKVHTLLTGSILLALSGAVVLIVAPSAWMSVAGIVLMGFAIAPIFPSMVSTTAMRVGREHVNNTIGMQIAGAGIGAATLPTLAGTIARVWTLEAVPWFIAGNILTLLIIQLLVQRRQLSR